MSLSFEPNIKRRYHRVTVPLLIRIGEISHKATDWSVGGFRVDSYAGELKPGSEFDCTLLLPYTEFSVHLPVKARVARRDKGTLGCAFVNLSPAQQSAMHHLVEAALEGRMGDLSETLGALRSPMVEAEKKLIEDAETTDLDARKMRLVPRVALFIGTVTALVTLAGGIMYYLASRVRVPDGVIVGNLVRVASPSPGRLTAVQVVEGQQVTPGAALFEIDNPDLRSALATMESKVKTTQAEYQAVAGQLEEERARLRLYAQITPLQVARTEATLQQINARLRLAKAELDRNEQLVQGKIGSQSDYEKALSSHEALVAERHEAATQLAIFQLNEKAIQEGLYFDGKEIHGRQKELEERLAVSASRLAESQQELERARRKVEELVIRSPSQGTVYAVMHPVGESLTAPTAVVSLQTGAGAFAMGNLMADEAVKVKPGMPVRIFIPTLDLELSGNVAQIGQQSPSTGSKHPAELESDSKLVPVKVALHNPPPNLPPGIRSILVIRTDPWLKFATF